MSHSHAVCYPLIPSNAEGEAQTSPCIRDAILGIYSRSTDRTPDQYSRYSLLSSTVEVQLAFTHRDYLVVRLDQVGLLRHPTVVDCVSWKPSIYY